MNFSAQAASLNKPTALTPGSAFSRSCNWANSAFLDSVVAFCGEADFGHG